MIQTIGMLIILGFSISIDTSALAATCGMTEKNFRLKQALILAIYFTIIQAGMLALGAFVGSTFSTQIGQVGDLVAGILLAFLGIKMLVLALIKKNEKPKIEKLTPLKQISLGFASSFDNAAAGLSLGLQNVNILLAAVVTGVIVAIMTIIGGMLGEELGAKIHKITPFIGSAVLLSLGIYYIITSA